MRYIFIIFMISLLVTTCKSCPETYTYKLPKQINDGLAIASLSEADLDTAVISKAIDQIECGKFNSIHSMLIYKDNALVLEKYFQGFDYQWDAPGYRGELLQWSAEMPHDMMSCTKSFTSTFIGIAIDKGFIKNVNQSIFDFLPEHQQYAKGGKAKITIEHLLTMSSGLEWNEWSAMHGTSANDIDRIYFECSDDPIKCVLERDLLFEPGEKFNYNGGGMIILGQILENASGMNTDEFSRKYLFDPLGIRKTEWYQFDNGLFATDGSFRITSRDMLKLGVTFLNKGKWHDERIISSNWVTKSGTAFMNNKGIIVPNEDTGKNGYAYSWWISQFSYKGKKINMFRADGWGGQCIMVFPELNMVVAFTGGNYVDKSHLFEIIEDYILPAIH